MNSRQATKRASQSSLHSHMIAFTDLRLILLFVLMCSDINHMWQHETEQIPVMPFVVVITSSLKVAMVMQQPSGGQSYWCLSPLT